MSKIHYKILSSETWSDFESLFGDRGACGGCWCMYWRLRNKDFEVYKGDSNKKLMKKEVDQKHKIGIILYEKNIPIGWCSVAPREDFPRLANSRILKPVDENKVWSIVCFFIDKKYRRQGYSVKLLKSVIDYCFSENVKIIEGYPVEPKGNMPPAFVWTGIAAAYLKTGFKEEVRRSETRPIMRYYL